MRAIVNDRAQKGRQIFSFMVGVNSALSTRGPSVKTARVGAKNRNYGEKLTCNSSDFHSHFGWTQPSQKWEYKKKRSIYEKLYSPNTNMEDSTTRAQNSAWLNRTDFSIKS